MAAISGGVFILLVLAGPHGGSCSERNAVAKGVQLAAELASGDVVCQFLDIRLL